MGIKAKNLIVGSQVVEQISTPEPVQVVIEKPVVEIKEPVSKPPSVSIETPLRKKFKKEKQHGLMFDHAEKSAYHTDMLVDHNQNINNK